MTDRATLLALAERCETAEGPDRELEYAIFRALHPKYAGPEWKPYAGGLRHVGDSSDARSLPPPHLTPSRFTASLDTAVTLVPEGWKWTLHSADAAGPPCAYCVPDMGRLPWPLWVNDITAATPTLALCAAALRARAAEAGQLQCGVKGEG